MSAQPSDTLTVELSFNDASYILVAAVQDEVLYLDAENKSTGEQWSGRFSHRYIEEMTAKTGNYKTFEVFLRMLSTAFANESDSVFIDLLTSRDLEALRNRSANSSNSPATKSNKRFLILTYVVEFDRVHYPLPLNFEAEPSPEALQRTVERLRAELADARAGSPARRPFARAPESSPSGSSRLKAENFRLTEENRKLRALLKSAAVHNRAEHDGQEQYSVEVDELTTRVEQLERELARKDRDLRELLEQSKNLDQEDSERLMEMEKRIWELEDALHRSEARSKRVKAKLEKQLEEANTRAEQAEQRLNKTRTRKSSYSFSPQHRRARSRSNSRSGSRPGSRRGSRPGSRNGSRAGSRVTTPSRKKKRKTSTPKKKKKKKPARVRTPQGRRGMHRSRSKSPSYLSSTNSSRGRSRSPSLRGRGSTTSSRSSSRNTSPMGTRRRNSSSSSKRKSNSRTRRKGSVRTPTRKGSAGKKRRSNPPSPGPAAAKRPPRARGSKKRSSGRNVPSLMALSRDDSAPEVRHADEENLTGAAQETQYRTAVEIREIDARLDKLQNLLKRQGHPAPDSHAGNDSDSDFSI